MIFQGVFISTYEVG